MKDWRGSLPHTNATSLPAAAQHVVMALYGDKRDEHVLKAGAILHNAWKSGGVGATHDPALVAALHNIVRAMSSGDPIYAGWAEESLRDLWEKS